MAEEGKKSFEVNIEAIRSAYDKIKDSEESKKAYQNLMLETLNRLMSFYARKWSAKAKGNQLATVEDLTSDAVVAMMESLWDYNPYIALPSTYFVPRIEAALKKKANEFLIEASSYYNSYLLDADRLLKEGGYDNGIYSPEITVDIIADVIDVPVKAATVVYELSRRTYSTLEDPDYIEGAITSSPEDSFLQAETVAQLLEQCKSLTPFEKWIIANKTIGDSSYRTIVSVLKSDESLLKSFSLEKRQVTSVFVKQIESTALRKLRGGYSKMNTPEKSEAKVYIQASDDDIDNAMRSVFEDDDVVRL